MHLLTVSKRVLKDNNIRQHASAYVSIWQHTSAYVPERQQDAERGQQQLAFSHSRHSSAYVSMRHPSSVSIRQHTSAYVSMRHPSSVSIRQYVLKDNRMRSEGSNSSPASAPHTHLTESVARKTQSFSLGQGRHALVQLEKC